VVVTLTVLTIQLAGSTGAAVTLETGVQPSAHTVVVTGSTQVLAVTSPPWRVIVDVLVVVTVVTL
jgi:hypothetical protein